MVKKGFFFSLDAFFAILIFTLMLVSIYGYFVGTQELKQQYYFSEDLFDVFINIRMEEFDYENQEYMTGIKTLNEWGFINDDITTMEQIITLNNQGYANYSGWIVQNLTYNLFDPRYGFSFDIEGLIYEEGGEQSSLVSRQRFVSGFKKT